MSEPEEPGTTPEVTTPTPPEAPAPRLDGGTQVTLGVVAGLLAGGLVAVFALGLAIAAGGDSTAKARVVAVLELAVSVFLFMGVARRSPNRFLVGFAIGAAIALLLSSMCFGALGSCA